MDVSECFEVLSAKIIRKVVCDGFRVPPKSSKGETDLNQDIVKDIGLSHGLVDVKLCAIDVIWSELKFVFRSQDRLKNSPVAFGMIFYSFF